MAEALQDGGDDGAHLEPVAAVDGPELPGGIPAGTGAGDGEDRARRDSLVERLVGDAETLVYGGGVHSITCRLRPAPSGDEALTGSLGLGEHVVRDVVVVETGQAIEQGFGELWVGPDP